MEKEVKTIGQEVTKAVETMKEAGKQGKQPQQQPEKEEKPDTPKSKGEKPQEGRGCQIAGGNQPQDERVGKMFGRAGTEERDFP